MQGNQVEEIKTFVMKHLRLPPLLAHALAWAAFFGVVFYPEGYVETTTTELPNGNFRTVFGHYPGPFMPYLGPEEIMLLLIPVALTGLAILLAWPRSNQSGWAKLAMWTLGALCLGYCLIPFSFIEEVEIEFIGMFSLPAAVALIGSAMIASTTKPPRATMSRR